MLKVYKALAHEMWTMKTQGHLFYSPLILRKRKYSKDEIEIKRKSKSNKLIYTFRRAFDIWPEPWRSYFQNAAAFSSAEHDYNITLRRRVVLQIADLRYPRVFVCIKFRQKFCMVSCIRCFCYRTHWKNGGFRTQRFAFSGIRSVMAAEVISWLNISIRLENGWTDFD